jgi:uncharacterized protein (TIGR03067 family)
MKKLLALVPVLLALAAPTPPDEATKKDPPKLQGTWAVVSVRLNGAEATAEALAMTKVVIDGDKFLIKFADHDEEFRMKLDPSKSPPTIDLTTPTGEAMLGVYDIDGDKLRIALSAAAKQAKESGRASKFESGEGSGVMLIGLKRLKKGAEQRLPEEAQKALEGAEELDLYSLDPTPGAKAKDEFHGWKVLGKTTLSKDDAQAAAAALVKGVADSDGTVASCFNPRHGIRATGADGAVYDFVISFECLQVRVYAGSKKLLGALTAESPQQTLDKLLKDARVPVGPKPGADK